MVAKKQFQCSYKNSIGKPTCLLSSTCKHPFMKMSGDILSKILLIGEAPGKQEDLVGLQFVGDSGQLLRHGLSMAGVTSFSMNNCVRCRPPGNRDPKMSEVHTCRGFLYKDIASMPNLELIVLFGNYAMSSILGHQGILENSGTYRRVNIEGKDYGVLCVMHPSYVLQNQNELNKFINHIGRIPNALTGSLVDDADKGTYYTIVTKQDWDALANKIALSKILVYDLETNSLDPYRKEDRITCISFSVTPREAYAIEIPDGEFPFLGLKTIMEDESIKKVGQNIKFDNLWMKEKWGINVRGTIWDTSISQFLLDENESHGLKSMAWKYTKLGGYEKRLVNGEPHLSSGNNLCEYSCIDSDITNRIFHIHKPKIEGDAKLDNLNKTLLIPVSGVLTDMERRGIRIDLDKLKECKKAVEDKLKDLNYGIYKVKSVLDFQKATGLSFNPRSSPQLREVLYKYEGLDVIKRTDKTKVPSVDRSVLEFYRDNSKICEILSDHSLYSSMKSKMIKELEEHEVHGRVHTHYWLTETTTGRSSSDDPNLQNVTKGKKDVVGIREVFVADEGYDLAELDYNQHEVRCMAEVASDDVLYNAASTGDIHRETASIILQKDPAKITDDERRDVGKTFVFGLSYGLTIYGIMKRLKCSEKDAQFYVDRFFGAYKNTKLYMDATALFVKENGYVKSRTGRYRRFPIWNTLEDKSIREAINMPIQSLAGDILLYSLVGVDEFLKFANAKTYLCLEVHDSLVLNLHKSERHLLPKIKHIMLNYFRQFIPFTYQLAVDVKVGPNWGQMVEIEV